MAKKRKDLSEGKISKQLMSLTWPMLFGMMGIVIFNLVDTYFVGKLGVHQLAAMSFSFPVVMFLNSLSQGIGVGTSSLIARNIIHAEPQEVKMMAGRSLLLGFIIVFIFVVVGIVTIRPLFALLGAENEVLVYVHDYMRIWYLGVPFVVLPMIGNNIIRATGNTLTPGLIMIAIALINCVLDPFLIFGIGPFPEMGIKGAALATVIARAIGLFATLIILIKEGLFSFRFGKWKDTLLTWKQVFYIGGPASLTMLITPLSVGFVTRILATHGKEAVAAFGVASRIEMFALLVIGALGFVIIIFVGQNLSKHQFIRIKEALNLSMKFSILWGVIIYAVLLFSGYFIASAFSDNSNVIDIAKNYFLIIGASYGFQGLSMLSTNAFNGINKPLPSTFFSLIRMLILYVPLAWLGSYLFGIIGIFWAGFIANVIVGIISYWYMYQTINRMQKTPKRRFLDERI